MYGLECEDIPAKRGVKVEAHFILRGGWDMKCQKMHINPG